MIYRPYSYFGGKAKMCHRILGLLPLVFNEWFDLFAGSGVITINRGRPGAAHLNDWDSGIYNFFKVLSDIEKGPKLISMLLRLEYHKDIFAEAHDIVEKIENGKMEAEPYIWAVAVFADITMSFSGMRNSFANRSQKGDYTHKYRAQISKHLPEVHRRLRGVTITNRKAQDILLEIAKKATAFVYLDPPYWPDSIAKGSSQKGYNRGMPAKEQIEMLEILVSGNLMYMLSGYYSEQYDEILLGHGAVRYELGRPYKSSQSGPSRDIAIEYIWVNYALPEVAKYYIDLSTAVTDNPRLTNNRTSVIIPPTADMMFNTSERGCA